MKRSEINRFIEEAAAFFAENGFALPPYANWTPLQWKQRGREADELRSCKLGWDVTDFSAGKFATLGLHSVHTSATALPTAAAKSMQKKSCLCARTR